MKRVEKRKMKKGRIALMEPISSVEVSLKSYPQGSVPFEPLDVELNRLFFSREEWVMVQKGLMLLYANRQTALKESLIQMELYEEEGSNLEARLELVKIKNLKRKLHQIERLIGDIEECSGVSQPN